MNDIRSLIARTLRVPGCCVGHWSLEVTEETQTMRTLSGTFTAPGRNTAALFVDLHLDRPAQQKLNKLLSDDTALGGWYIEDCQVVHDDYGEGRDTAALKVMLLHGYNTQHLFKALYKAMSAKGRPPKKRSRK